MYTAACYLPTKLWHFQKALSSGINMCRYLRRIVHIYIFIFIKSELSSIDGQSSLSVHLQEERFFVKYNRHRRAFAWRHLETGQYVAQSGLHLHQTEPHSCKKNKKNIFQELLNSGGFTISLISPSIAFNKIYYVTRYRYNNIFRRQKTNFSDLRKFMIKAGK